MRGPRRAVVKKARTRIVTPCVLGCACQFCVSWVQSRPADAEAERAEWRGGASKRVHGTPTVATATPLEVRIFRDETDDGLSRVDQCVSALNPALEEAEPATIVLQGSGRRAD